MLKKATFFGTLVGLGFLFGVISGAIASEKMPDDHNMQPETSKPTEFKAINQPLTMKATFLGTLVGFGFLLGTVSGVIASEKMPDDHNMQTETSKPTEFKAIDQPITNKILVTVGGVGLIGAELWWFLFSKPKSKKAESESGIQEVTVVVDGGYEPSRIVVNAGQLVRLNFLRQDPSSCLEEVRLADFQIAQHLEINKTTTIEFTPPKAGNYEFACGMNMFRGAIEAK